MTVAAPASGRSRSCLYIKKLADVDQGVLRELIARCWKHMNAKYG